MPPAVTPRRAATVVVVRERAGAGPFEVLLLRRDASLAFLGGSHVFPGGVVEDADGSPRLAALADGRPPAARFPHLGADDELALRLAAVRELVEEASVLIARSGGRWATSEDACGLLGALARGTAFDGALAAAGLRPALDALVPLAHFVTPRTEPRRFDTCFFLAVLPPGQDASPVAGESDAHVWTSPADAVAAGTDGSMLVPPPTLIVLAQLAVHASLAAVLAWARERTIPYVESRVEHVEGTRVVTMPGEGLFPRDHPWWRPGGLRFTASEGGWRPDVQARTREEPDGAPSAS